MKLYVGMEVQLLSFSASAIDGGEWSALLSGRFAFSEVVHDPLNKR
jgi:hypothetical protein